MSATLSQHQVGALIALAEHGALERRRGGFWTYPGCPVTRPGYLDGGELPAWYVGTETVMALLKRDLVEPDDPAAYWATYRLTDAGRRALAEAR